MIFWIDSKPIVKWGESSRWSSSLYCPTQISEEMTIGKMQLTYDDMIQSHSMSNPPLFDINFKDKIAWVWTTLNSGLFYLVEFNCQYASMSGFLIMRFPLLNRLFRQLLSFKLRVVHTQAILFLKSMSERGGSDIERL